MLRTEYDFTLPFGVIGQDGTLRREGKMRLATAADEILPLRDPRVQQNGEYLIICILARVVTQIGGINDVTTDVIEKLFVQDLAYLQDLYNRINQMKNPAYEGVCPECGKALKIPVNFLQAGR